MGKFALKESEVIINTKIKVFDLLINGKDEFENYCNQIKLDGNLIGHLYNAITYIEQSANLVRLPRNKFRNITHEKSTIKQYEVKSGIVRIYLFHEKKRGRIIVMGGKKDTQKKDIKRFQKIVSDYCVFKEKREFK